MASSHYTSLETAQGDADLMTGRRLRCRACKQVEWVGMGNKDIPKYAGKDEEGNEIPTVGDLRSLAGDW